MMTGHPFVALALVVAAVNLLWMTLALLLALPAKGTAALIRRARAALAAWSLRRFQHRANAALDEWATPLT